jgi:hypothetical protein
MKEVRMKRILLLGLMVLVSLLAACGTGDSANAPASSTAPAPEDRAAVEADSPTATTLLTEADIIAPTPSGLSLQPQLAEADINMDDVVALLPPDAIPAILPDEVDDLLITAEEAEAQGMDQTVRVIGVSVNGESEAYPIPFLSRHEIVNTEVGDQILAVTW